MNFSMLLCCMPLEVFRRGYATLFSSQWKLKHMNLFVKKPLSDMLQEADEEWQNALKRHLNGTSLIMLGVGATIGAGIFLLTARAIAMNAGPGVTLSFVVAGLGCAFAGLCYAEFAAMVPVSACRRCARRPFRRHARTVIATTRLTAGCRCPTSPIRVA